MVDKTEKFNWLVRVGYFSRAVLYIVLGFIALTSAGRVSEGTEGIFRAVEELPAGTLLLWVLVVGLAAYALFRLASPLFDIENNGSDAKGWAMRIGHAGSAIAHVALAWTAYQFATGQPSSGGQGASQAAAGVLSIQFGDVVIGLLGIAFFIAAAAQAQKGISGKFMQRISPAAPDATRWVGAAGYLARAVVFVVIGWSLIETGFLASGAGNVKTLGDAVASLAGTGWLFTVTAIGLLLFGLFSLILARYRIIPDLDPSGRVPNFRA
ncbi:DUF1206 domain-containing protein [Erythrobacter sp.]|uniref:DUF1206 domain-containing protein n=1 Tax=Erythrobacter sp. TaxID=1042 RepID=UPI0025CE75D4|nr:DUF1206 domain-containing protein [Erythrobacter sp.]